MAKSISDLATDPQQYDKDQILWNEEGHGLSPVRRMFLEYLSPFLGNVAGKDVLDVGCGQGWLSSELASHGAHVLGIDPSKKNIQAATRQYPDTRFEQSDLQAYAPQQQFDIVAAVMVFEHLPDLAEGFQKIRSLLKVGGELLMIVGDFDKFTRPRHDYTLETEELGPGEVATKTDYGERAGIIYDINRTVDRFVDVAQQTGFTLTAHQPITAPDWLVAEQPRYAIHTDRPLFHLLDFEVE